MKKIKVLMVLGNSGRGGAQTFAVNVLRMIDREKYQIDFVFNEVLTNGYEGEIQSLGSKIYTVPYFRVYNIFNYIEAWEKILRKGNYNIVHGHVSSSAVVYLNVARKYNCKTIIHSHSAGYRGNFLLKIVKYFFTIPARYKADYWLACSELAANRLFGNNYKNYNKYFDIPNAIVVEDYLFDQKKSDKFRDYLGINNTQRLYGHVGSFSEAKNHKFLLDVFEEILKIEPSARFALAGDGYLRKKIEKSILKRGLNEKIKLLGNISNVNEFLMALDVLIFPSLFEGFPVAILESEASGLKSIVSDTITKEVGITNCVSYLSLSDSPRKWAELAIKSKSIERSEYNYSVANSKYNMRHSVQILEKIYSESYETNRRN